MSDGPMSRDQGCFRRRVRRVGWLLLVLAAGAIAPAAAHAAMRGSHETSSCTESRGWTCDSTNYARSVLIHVFRDGPYDGGGSGPVAFVAS